MIQPGWLHGIDKLTKMFAGENAIVYMIVGAICDVVFILNSKTVITYTTLLNDCKPENVLPRL